MAKHMRGQFYILAAFIVGMYIFFLLRMFTSTTTSFEVPEIPSVGYVLDAAQDSLEEEGGIDTVREALNFIQEPIGLRCTSLATGEGTCDLYEDEWACGVNVTVVYRGKVDMETTRRLYKQDFEIGVTRTPVYLRPNRSASLVRVWADMPVSSGVLRDTSGRTVKGSWSGTNLTLRVNLVKNRPTVIYAYHTSGTGHTIYQDAGVLDGDGYDASKLYSEISSRRETQNLSLSDLSNLENNAGPRMLFIPGAYPESYGSNLRDYVAEGGVVVAPYGLCVLGGSCLVGNMESVTDSHTLAAVGDFSSLNPVTTNSDHFTDPDIPWVVYNGTATNSSRAAIGANAYGEGYVVFLGNESMLSSWDQLGDFLDGLLGWGLHPVSVSKYVCPDQSP